ncbi:unnamed protein product [Prunus armeniaca]|uniref:Uncharacterized protein n=1 Tax=Prunus armeniaca TaxID=36596 RepID=A0A6J5Y0W5_PRUAR|nr:unnamed protein product [Prunus armeniaca]
MSLGVGQRYNRPLHDYCTTNEEFQWLPFGGFIWVSYIPQAWFSDQLNECDVLEDSFASDHEALLCTSVGYVLDISMTRKR